MEIYQLRLFRDLAYELSFIRVARLNRLSQPAVSFQIRKLEQSIGVRLFERGTRKVQLTNEGQLLLPHAEEILKSCHNLATTCGEVQNLPSGEVRIASIHSIGMYELGSALRRFLATYPKIHIRLQYLASGDIYDLVRRRKVDFGIVAYPQSYPLVTVTPFGRDRLVLASPPGHPLAGKLSVQLSQLRGEPFIAFDEGIPTREAIDKIFRAKKVNVDIRMTNDNIYAIKSAVRAKLGLAIVPEPTIAEDVAHGLIFSSNIRGVDLYRPRAILTHSKRTLSRAAQIFLESITAEI